MALGFGGELVNKGTFVVDARSSGQASGGQRIVEITARAFSKTNERGHSTLQSQKTRSFSGITLGDFMLTVASEHGLTARVDSRLVNVPVEHIDQLDESDMNLVTRIAGECGAVSKITPYTWGNRAKWVENYANEHAKEYGFPLGAQDSSETLSTVNVPLSRKQTIEQTNHLNITIHAAPGETPEEIGQRIYDGFVKSLPAAEFASGSNNTFDEPWD
ncbi:hypothetical protein [Serratia rhizosphaerae]